MDQRQNVSSGHLSLRRRDLIAIIGGVPILLPFAVRAQQKAMPVIGFLSTTSPDQAPPQLMASFQLGLQETGYVAGQNIAIEFGVPVATEPKVRFSASRVFLGPHPTLSGPSAFPLGRVFMPLKRPCRR
jgi:hypothetical protein